MSLPNPEERRNDLISNWILTMVKPVPNSGRVG